jgi:hypothetical protein
VVYFDNLDTRELEAIGTVKWPTKEEILDALSASAYDTIEDLAVANEDIRRVLTSKEVS